MRYVLSVRTWLHLSFFAGAATAQERSSPIPTHLPLVTEACFGRVYDAKHLADHPKQRVTSSICSGIFRPIRQPKTMRTAEDLKKFDGDTGILMTAFVRFRDRPGLFWHGFHCRREESGEVHCGIDCDGRHVQLEGGRAVIVARKPRLCGDRRLRRERRRARTGGLCQAGRRRPRIPARSEAGECNAARSRQPQAGLGQTRPAHYGNAWRARAASVSHAPMMPRIWRTIRSSRCAAST